MSREGQRLKHSAAPLPDQEDSQNQNYTLYLLLSTPDGYREVINALAAALGCEVKELTQKRFNNDELSIVLETILQDLDEMKIDAIQEIADFELVGGVDLSHVYLVVLAAAAIEGGEMVRFLHKFGKMLFEVLACGEGWVVYERTVRFVKMFEELTTIEVQRSMQKLGIERGDKVHFQDFEMILYQLFKAIDEKPKTVRMFYINPDNSKEIKFIEINQKDEGIQKSTHSCSLI